MIERQKTETEITKSFFEWLGRGIAAWARVDDELFRVFMMCIGPRKQSAIIFYRIPSLSSRLDLTADIVRSYFVKGEDASKNHKSKEEKSLDAFVKQAKNLLSVRTRIAHHHALLRRKYEIAMENDPIDYVITDTYYEIVAGEHEILHKPQKSAPLKREDLEHHFRDVMTLCNTINNFGAYALLPLLEERRRKERLP